MSDFCPPVLVDLGGWLARRQQAGDGGQETELGFHFLWGVPRSAWGLLGLLGSLRLESGVWRSLEPGGLGGGGGWRSGRDEEG